MIKPKFRLKLPLQLLKFYALVAFAFKNTYKEDKDIVQKNFSTLKFTELAPLKFSIFQFSRTIFSGLLL